jgi:nucleoside-diphosphate-sugar epimerase
VKPLPAKDLEHVFSLTRPLWDEVRGRRIFLSGATGFFGAWLLESMLHANSVLGLNLSATVLSRDPEAFARGMPHVAADGAITLWRGDVRNFDVPDHEYAYVVHAAAPTSAECSGRPFELLRTLVDGTRQMLALAASHGTRRFLFVSSGAVYGPQPGHITHVPEDYAGGLQWLDANAAYAEGKRVAEQMCAIFADDSAIQFKIARCFAFVGPHLPLNAHFAIGNFIADALAGRPIEVRGDGNAVRSYLYAADLAIWLWQILLGPNLSEPKIDVWNVGSEEAITIGELACIVAEEIQPGLPVKVHGKPEDSSSRRQYVPSVRKAQTELGLQQTIGLREAIRRTAEWYRYV